MKRIGMTVALAGAALAGATSRAGAEDRARAPAPAPEQPAPSQPAPRQPAPSQPAPKPPAPKPRAPAKRALAVELGDRKALSASSLTVSAVASKVEASYLGGVLRCYESAYPRSPGRDSTVTLSFQVTAEGTTAAVRAASVIGVPALEACLARQAATWRFAAPKSATGAAVAAAFELGVRLQFDEDDARAMADLLSGDDQAVYGDMSAPPPSRSLEEAIAEAKSSGNTVGIGGTGGKGGRATGEPKSGGGPTPPSGAAPSGRVTVADRRALDESSLSADAVLMKIQSAYFAGIKRCYKELLKSDPAARGRVLLALTVSAEGRAVSTSAKGLASSLETCIGQQMKSWRFPVPRSEQGKATEASFEIALVLLPE